MVLSDDFLHFLKIKKKFVEFTKTILWLSKVNYANWLLLYNFWTTVFRLSGLGDEWLGSNYHGDWG